MRAILLENAFRPDLMAKAVLLNVAFLGLGAGVFLASFRAARVRGLLLQMGE
jgi:ABC-2 type transport system permease protein